MANGSEIGKIKIAPRHPRVCRVNSFSAPRCIDELNEVARIAGISLDVSWLDRLGAAAPFSNRKFAVESREYLQ